MALAQLTPEQTRTWAREEKDRWWFENIYRGDLPQLTLRSGLTGFFLGGILSATNARRYAERIEDRVPRFQESEETQLQIPRLRSE